MHDVIDPLQQQVQGRHVINITAMELQNMIRTMSDIQLVDVRMPAEYSDGRVPGAILVPIEQVNDALTGGLINKDKPVVFLCQSGLRGYIVGMLAITYDYEEVFNLLQRNIRRLDSRKPSCGTMMDKV